MAITSALVMYAVLWFLAVLLVLPFMHKSQADAGKIVPGTHAGAPHDFKVKRMAVIVSIVAAVLWLILFFVITSGLIHKLALEI